MRIVDLTAWHLEIPLLKVVRHASHTRTTNDTLIIRTRLDDGTEGWGEGLPRPYVTGETIESVFDQFRQTDLKRQLDTEIPDLETAVRLLEGLKLSGTPTNVRDCFGNALQCAIEVSILDAVTRSLGVPFSEVVQHVPEVQSLIKPRDRVHYSMVIGVQTAPWKEIAYAVGIRWMGFRQCKIKVGRENQDDVASLQRLRRYLGPRMDLRLDANEAWKPDELEARLTPLLPYHISSVEQPVPHELVSELPRVRLRLPVPIMLDESLCSYEDGQRAIDQGTCDIFNIRISKCGGFIKSLKLAALADRAGLGYQLGCQVGETAILSAAGRHFACMIRNIRFLEGSFDHHLIKEPLSVEDLTFERGGWFNRGGRAPALRGPGLGFTFKGDAIPRLQVREEQRQIN